MPESRIDELRRRLAREPGSRLFAQLAEELRKGGETAEAIRVARAGLAASPVYPSARLTLGLALQDSGDRKAARGELSEAVRQAPENILARRALGQVLDELGELAAALEQFAAVLRMEPGDAAAKRRIRELALRIAPEPGDGAEREIEARVEAGGASGISAEGEPVLAPADETAHDGPGRIAEAAPLDGAGVPGGAVDATAGPGGDTGAVEFEEPFSGGESGAGADGNPPGPWDQMGGGSGGAQAPESQLAAVPEGEEAGGGATPFSSSTLAELYFRQGLHAQAIDVYRQVVESDPTNSRARARLFEIESAAGVDGGADGRRRAIERTIEALEALLVALRGR